MIRRLALLIGIFAIVVSSRAYNVSGTIQGGTNQGLKFVWAIPTSIDTPYVTIAIPWFNTYTFIGGLPEGSYVLFAFQDANSSALPDPDEMRGFYGGQPPEILVLTSDTSDIDIELSAPNSGGFTGAVSYSGSNTGATFIIVHRDPAFADSIRGFGVVMSTTGIGSYTAFVDSFGVYYAFAFMDLNMNFQHDSNEPYGVYGGSTPAQIDVQPTDFPENVDIVLEDPNASCDPGGPLTSCFSIGQAYPNPFNAITVIPFTLGATEKVELSVHDILGRKVSLLAHGVYGAGEHRVVLQADGIPSGLYFINLKSQTQSAVGRVLLLK